jgi:uncharacterized protein YPO0396
VRHAIAVPIIIAALAVSLIAGCGGSSSSNSTTASTATSAGAPVCTEISNVQSAVSDFKQLDASTASVKQVQKAIYTLGVSVKALSSAASQASGQAKSSLKSAASSFQSKLKSAVNQPVSQQLITIGTALGQLESSLSQTKTELDCNP